MNSVSQESESETVKKHAQAIRYMALPFASLRGSPLEDLIQEGSIALVLASRKWDPARGVKLWTFARKSVLGAFFRLVAKEAAEPCRLIELVSKSTEQLEFNAGDDRCSLDNGSEFLANVEATIADDVPTPEDLAAVKEDLAALKEDLEELSDIEREVLWSYFGEDRSLRETEAATGHSHGCVQRTFRGAIAKLRARAEGRA